MNTTYNVYFLQSLLFICICVHSSFGITMGRKSTIQVGNRFGKLEVIEVLNSAGAGHHARVICLCDCGKTTNVNSHLLKTKIKSCGCSQNDYENLVGKEYGKITILTLNSETKRNNTVHRKYECVCNSCGKKYLYDAGAIRRNGFVGCRCSDNTSSKRYVFSNYTRNAQLKNRTFDLSFKEFVEICEGKCYYCGTEPQTLVNKKDLYGTWKYNGVDRVDNSIGYTKENSVTCCKTCNMMKKNMTFDEFTSKIKSIYSHISEAIGWGT